MDSFIDSFRLKLLDTLGTTIQYLNDNNLRWSIAYGSAIGAVRHNGIIPWDDDIDIWMPKEDYDKLLEMSRSHIIGNKYKIVSMKDIGYWLPFAKIYDTSTTIWEYKQLPFLFGVYIDIFPVFSIDLDYVHYSNYAQKIRLLYRHLQSSYKKIDKMQYFKELSTFHWGTMLNHLQYDLNGLFSNSNKIIESIDKLEQEVNNPVGRYCATFCSIYRQREYFPAELFHGYVEMPFETYIVRIAVGYDTILRKIYGDYMTPPPPEQQVLTHKSQRYYCNLKEGLTLDEVKTRIKQGERLVF